jgi:hypothetical protein
MKIKDWLGVWKRRGQESLGRGSYANTLASQEPYVRAPKQRFQSVHDPLGMDMEPITCPQCGIHFSIQESLRQRRLRDGLGFHCPNGHESHYTQKSTEEKDWREKHDDAVKTLKDAEARLAMCEDALQSQARDIERMEGDAACWRYYKGQDAVAAASIEHDLMGVKI